MSHLFALQSLPLSGSRRRASLFPFRMEEFPWEERKGKKKRLSEIKRSLICQLWKGKKAPFPTFNDLFFRGEANPIWHFLFAGMEIKGQEEGQTHLIRLKLDVYSKHPPGNVAGLSFPPGLLTHLKGPKNLSLFKVKTFFVSGEKTN